MIIISNKNIGVATEELQPLDISVYLLALRQELDQGDHHAALETLLTGVEFTMLEGTEDTAFSMAELREAISCFVEIVTELKKENYLAEHPLLQEGYSRLSYLKNNLASREANILNCFFMEMMSFKLAQLLKLNDEKDIRRASLLTAFDKFFVPQEIRALFLAESDGSHADAALLYAKELRPVLELTKELFTDAPHFSKIFQAAFQKKEDEFLVTLFHDFLQTAPKTVESYEDLLVLMAMFNKYELTISAEPVLRFITAVIDHEDGRSEQVLKRLKMFDNVYIRSVALADFYIKHPEYTNWHDFTAITERIMDIESSNDVEDAERTAIFFQGNWLFAKFEYEKNTKNLQNSNEIKILLMQFIGKYKTNKEAGQFVTIFRKIIESELPNSNLPAYKRKRKKK